MRVSCQPICIKNAFLSAGRLGLRARLRPPCGKICRGEICRIPLHPVGMRHILKHMIKIAPLQPSNSSSVRRKKNAGSVSDADFGDYLSAAEAEEARNAAPVAANKAVGNVNPLLGLQEISDEEMYRKQEVRHANVTLDALDDLRLAILSGGVPRHTLEQIDKQVRHQRQQTNDPALEAILDDIELRAAVELAKYDLQ